MRPAAVSLTRCRNYDRALVAGALVRQFELLGGIERFVGRGDRVLIKPNLIAPKSRRRAVQTDPAVIVETARLLMEAGARPFVGDSPAWGSVFGCLKALGVLEELSAMSVPVLPLDRPRKCRVGSGGTTVGISSVALDADVIINLPKLKTHQQLLATFAVKNMFGSVGGKRKAYWHFARGGRSDFCELLIGIYRLLAPAVTIIDAVTVMEGPGPISGRPRQLGWLVGGTDPIACETVCCRLVGIDPDRLPMIRAARGLGFGSRWEDGVSVVGDDPPEPCGDFELPRLIPVRFSLFHVARSVCKQVVLLAREGRKKLTIDD
jgi:uncharacterized protein (DUF362 family)